jgi:hypothetical protein
VSRIDDVEVPVVGREAGEYIMKAFGNVTTTVASNGNITVTRGTETIVRLCKRR